MKRLILAVLFFAVFVPAMSAQNADPDAVANAATMQHITDRMRGKQLPVQDRQGIAAPTGKTLNIRDIAVKTRELNEVVHSVNLDVINMSKGILAADLTAKLKKIEKLSKELRRSFEQ